MAGPQSIQRYPAGLLDLLGMKGTGQGPVDLSGNVVPVLETEKFYTQRELILQTDVAVGVDTQGQNASVTVPQDEIWVLQAASMHWIIGAANCTPAVALQVSLPNANINQGIALRYRVQAMTVGDITHVEDGYWFDNPPYLWPGSSIAAVLQRTISGIPATIDLICNAYVRVLPA